MNYEKIGFKAGLEIHQQLDTHKLFCRCKSCLVNPKEKPIKTITRKLKSLAGETGQIDKAALHEKEKNLTFEYNYYNTNCMIELDEEPPLPMDSQALKIVQQISLMLKAKISPVISVMRKTVVNGSNTSGFQRTALVSREGVMNLSFGKVGVESVCIEEDSARKVERKGDKVIYNLDRLGIPLVEIATAPDIKNSEQVYETAEYLGMILRSTGKVKRGLGTIRQDVNVSISEGNRVEIKGAQNLKQLSLLAENEAQRQVNLVALNKELKKINPKRNDKVFDLTKILEKTECKFINSAIKKKEKILGIKLEGFKGYLGRELLSNRRFATEISDYAKIKVGVGLMHSDELPKFGVSQNEVDKISKELKLGKNDAFIFVVSTEEKAKKGIKVILDRAYNFTVPKEVRQANEDGTTTYLRPMPGSSRMYPETDIPLIKTNTKDIKLPELIIDKKTRFEKLGLNKQMAEQLSKSDYTFIFDELVKYTQPKIVADLLLNGLKDIQTRMKGNLELISDKVLLEVFNNFKEGKIPKSAISQILTDVSLGKEINYNKYKAVDTNEIEKDIKQIIEQFPELNEKALMGEVMKKFRGKVDGRLAMQLIMKLKK